MNREHQHLLINRAVDGAASVEEREELARALKADPLLRSELDDTEAVHTATTSLFRQLALPEDFSKRVMRRIQGVEVPADAQVDSVRLPAVRPANGRAAKIVSTHRRRARIYAIVAFVSAAASLLLAIGVLTGAFSNNTTGTTTTEEGTKAADGRRGVPDTGNPTPHRDSHPQPPLIDDRTAPDGDAVDSPEAKDPGVVDPASKPEGQRDPRDPAEKPESKPEQPVDPKDPGIEPGTPEEVVKGEPEPEPEGVVEDQPDPSREPEGSEAAATVVLGRMLVLSGQVHLVGADGSLTRLDDDQPIHAGDRLRTKWNAVVMLQLGGGDVTLGKDTEVSIESESVLRLEECDGKEKGMIAVDRNAGHSGGTFEVACGEYSLFAMSGATVLERKSYGMDITKAVGFATLTHEVFGSILFTEESGYEAKVRFGKEYETPKALNVTLPDWSAETRAQAVMLSLGDVLAARKFTESRERSYVNTNLPLKLKKLMAYPTTTDSAFEFLSGAIEREQFNGASLVKMAGEVENAYAEVTELSPDVVNSHAGRAAMVAENYEQWHDYFYRLMRPPVEPKGQPQTPVPVPDCPNDKKMKRVDKPQPRKVIKPAPVPEESDEEPADTTDEETND